MDLRQSTKMSIQPKQTRLEFLFQLRNARLQHLIYLKQENKREDRHLDMVIEWAQGALNKAEKHLGLESLKWTKMMLSDPNFEEEEEEDKQDIIEDNLFYNSWLT